MKKSILILCLVALFSSACNELDENILFKTTATKVPEVDHKLYSTIVQKKSIASYMDGTYFVDTEIWVGEKEHITNRITLEYYELETCKGENLEIKLKTEYEKALIKKKKIDSFLMKINGN